MSRKYKTIMLCHGGAMEWEEYVEVKRKVVYNEEGKEEIVDQEDIDLKDIVCLDDSDSVPRSIDVEEDMYIEFFEVKDYKERLLVLAKALKKCKISIKDIKLIEDFIKDVPYEDVKEELKKALVIYRLICTKILSN